MKYPFEHSGLKTSQLNKRRFGLTMVAVGLIGGSIACSVSTNPVTDLVGSLPDGGKASSSSSGGSSTSSSGGSSTSSSGGSSTSSSGGSSSGGSSSGGSSSGGSSSGGTDGGADGALDSSSDGRSDATVFACPANMAGQRSAIITAIAGQLGPFRTSNPGLGKCTVNQLKALETAVGAGTINTWDDVATNLGATCGACAVTPKTATTWGGIVKVDATGAVMNSSGSLSGQGMSAACAETLFDFDYCADVACQDCADADVATCKQTVQASGGTCANEFAADISTKCSAGDQTIETNAFNGAKNGGLKLVLTYAIYNACVKP